MENEMATVQKIQVKSKMQFILSHFWLDMPHNLFPRTTLIEYS